MLKLQFALLLLLLTGCSSIKNSSSNDAKITIHGIVTKSGSYCGGARPTDEMLEQIERSIPYADLKLYIRKGNRNSLDSPVIDSTITNEKGEFKLELNSGSYVLLFKNQLDKSIFNELEKNTNIQIVDQDCLNSWWENGLKLINTETDQNLTFHFKKRCFLPEGIPCLNYTGPYPP